MFKYYKMNTKIEMIEDFKDSVCSPTLVMIMTMTYLITKLITEIINVQTLFNLTASLSSIKKMSQIGYEIFLPLWSVKSKYFPSLTSLVSFVQKHLTAPIPGDF